MRFTSGLILVLGISGTLLFAPRLAWAQPPAALPAGLDTLDDWAAYDRVEKQLKGAAPQVAIDTYTKFYESRPKLVPLVGIKVTANIADLYSDKLKNYEKALEIADWGIKKYADEPAVVWLIQKKSQTLNTLKRPEEAAKVWEDNWNSIVRGATHSEDWLVMYASITLRDANDAYDALGQSEKAIPMLLKAFSAMPFLLDDKAQGQGNWKSGWMYNALIPKLLKANRGDEALSWAKMHYALCSFDKDCIARANTSLGRVWGEQEAYPSIRLFAQAQEEGADPALKNPLSGVKLPVLDEKPLKEHIARLKTTPGSALSAGKVKEQITLLLAQSDFGAAMTQARLLLKDKPENPEGALQICRVFKAADLNTRRANQFLLYLEGKAENPIPAFVKEHEAKPAAPATDAPKT